MGTGKLRPHILGIDDAPFRKSQTQEVPIIGVMMEGATLVEVIALGAFPVDGEGATEYLAQWISGLRLFPTLQAVVLGGITIAGLGIIDLASLSKYLELPVIAVTRQAPASSQLSRALKAAGLSERLPILERIPSAHQLDKGLYMKAAGTDLKEAAAIVRATLNKSQMPEPLRIAHLIGAALVFGESKGRV